MPHQLPRFLLYFNSVVPRNQNCFAPFIHFFGKKEKSKNGNIKTHNLKDLIFKIF